jgi:hypothetical protein
MLKTTALRQVIVAMVIAVAAATVHGAWFAPTAAITPVPEVASVRLSSWDEYQRIWTHTFLTEGALIRSAESQIVEFRTQSAGTVDASSIPAFIEILTTTDLQALNIPQAPVNPVDAPTMAASGTPVYGRLRVSGLDYMNEPRPAQDEPWPGPLMPTLADINANDVNGSVGVWNATLTTDGNAEQVSFTWDIGRWAKGDVFLGLNNSTYKVIDRRGEFKRFVANADYGRLDVFDNPAGNITTGCAANWQTGEIYATNFSEMEPAVHIIGRHPGAANFPYADFSRSISTRVMRAGAPADHYPIDTAPESVVFDGNMNLYVAHSFANWDYDTGETWAIDDAASEVFDGLSTYVVDENGDLVLMRKDGTADPLTQQLMGSVSVRLFLDDNGALEFMGPTAYAAVPTLLDLPRAFYADREDGTWLVDGAGERVPVRWPLGKRLHRYNNTATTGDATYAGSESASPDRDVFWTFTGRQGTDWVDLAYAYIPTEPGQPAPPMVAYYTSEDSFIHRYDVATGRQLPDFGGGRLFPRNEIQDRRFHGLRILPPGDGTGGLLVAAGDAVFRFDQHGVNIQQYQIFNDPDVMSNSPESNGLVQGWYTLEVDPGGRTFWVSSHDSGWIYEFDIASGRELQRIRAVEYYPLGDPVFPNGQRIEGICIMWEYTAAQEICGDGIDNDGDGLIDEGCTAIESCSVLSPGDDDGDGFSDANDPDCGLDAPPVAVDDAYETTQGVPLMVAAGEPNDVLANDYDPDNLQADTLLHDEIRVHQVGTSTPDTPAGTPVVTTAGGSVILQPGGGMLYTPPSGFHGIDTFVYLLTDYEPIPGVDTPEGINISNVATVTILVRPLVANDSYTMPERTTLDVAADAANSILVNDPSGPLTVSAAGPAGVTPLGANPSVTFVTANGGTVTVYATGRFTYTPLTTFIGTDTFEYRGNDSFSDSINIATVTIIVEDVNEVVARDDTYTTPYETPLAANLLANDSDPEGHPFRIVQIAGQPVAIGGTVTILNGTVRLDSASSVTITPADEFSGVLTFEYTIEDTPGDASGMEPVTDTALVTVTVGVRPIVAQDDYYITAQNQVLTTSLLSENQSILLNDNGATSVYSFGLYQPSTDFYDTLLNGEPLVAATAAGGSVTLNPDGTFVYTPPLNFVGTDSYRYNVWDNTNNRSAATVFILVTPTSSTVTVSTPDPSVYGTVVTVTATVTCGADQAPSVGTVTFRLNGDVIATGVSVVGGVATTTLPASLVVGNYTLQADYSGSMEQPTVCPGSFGADTHQVVPKPLTITADPRSKMYGTVATFAGTEFTTAGLLFDDAVHSATLVSPTGAPATATVAGGPYPITPSEAVGTGLSNYTITYVNGPLTVTPAPLTVQAHDKERQQGQPNPVLDGVWTGLLNGDVITADYTTTAGIASPEGTYPITPTPVDPNSLLSNYVLTIIPGTLVVTPAAPVCVVPAAPALALVRNQSTFDGTLQGSIQLMNPVNVTLNSTAVVTGQLMMVGTPGITINGSPASYGGDVFGTGAVTPTNHQFIINSGATLGQLVRRTDAVALPVVTAPPTPTSTRSVTMNSSSDDPGDFSTLRNLTLNSNVGPVAVPAGTYGTFIANTNTAFVLGVAGGTEPTVYNFQTLTLNSGSSLQVVGPIELNVRNSMSFNGPVGDASHPEWLTLRVSHQDVTLNSNVPLYGYVEAPNGRVTINNGARLEGGLAADALTINSGGLLVLVQGEPELCSFELVVTIDDKVKMYGDPDPELTWQLTSGGPVPDGVLSGLISRVTGESVGAYTIGQGTLAAGGDYTLTVIPGTLTVLPRPAVVTAGHGTKTYGDSDPALSDVTTTGFLNADLGVLTLTQSRAVGEAVGSYPTTALASGEVLSNYEVTYVAGAFTITPKAAVVIAGGGTKMYGTTDPALSPVTTSGFVGTDAASLTLSQQRTAGENVGTYDTTANASGAVLANYSVSYVDGTFTITPAPLTVQANDKTIFQGDPLPTLDGVWTGIVSGDTLTATYTTDATSASGVGTYDIMPNPQDPGGVLSNYTLTIIPGTLTILPKTAPCVASGYTTYSQGGWGSKPSGGNPGAFLAANFATVYPTGSVKIGGTYWLRFTSASAIEKFLPAGGSSKPLTSSATNPTRSSAGNIAAQLLALRLATDFSAAGVTKKGLGDMVLQSGVLAGKSVNEILALADAVVGGQTSALPSGLTVSSLSSILESLNMNYHEGTANEGRLACPGGATDEDDESDDDPTDPTEGQVCYVGTAVPQVGANQTWWSNPDGTVTIRTTLSRSFVDNTYGTTQIGWSKGHTFSSLVGSDAIQVALYDAKGVLRLETKLDYISASSAFPSGYGSLGISGGDGKFIGGTGTASDVVSADSSLSQNFNRFGYVLTTNSPATTASYATNASYPEWIWDVYYDVTVKASAFGPAGFGYPRLTSMHASPSKTGSNTEPVAVTECGDGDVDQPNDEPPVPVCAFRTQTQGGWGSTPNGTNPGALLAANFGAVFGKTGVVIGGGKKLTFTSAAAVSAFLPQGGSASVLKKDGKDVKKSDGGGVFAGQVLALQISVAFSKAKVTTAGLADLKLKSGLLAGKTVGEVLTIANSVLGGGGLPKGVSLQALNDIVDAINNNFVDGTMNGGYLDTSSCR